MSQTIDGALYNAEEALRQLAALTREASRRADLLATLRERLPEHRIKVCLPLRDGGPWYVQFDEREPGCPAPPVVTGRTEVEALEAAVGAVESAGAYGRSPQVGANADAALLRGIAGAGFPRWPGLAEAERRAKIREACPCGDGTRPGHLAGWCRPAKR